MKIAHLIVLILFFLAVPSATRAASQIEMWWPTSGAELTGVQPLKGLQKDLAVDDYVMYWQVDGGELNRMGTSRVDYPHKSAVVDFSKWNWKGKGPYQLTFKTKTNAGVDIAQSSMSVYVGQVTPSVPTPTPVPAPAPVPAPVVVVPTAPTPVVVDTMGTIEVWWPTDKARLTNSVVLKALLQNKKLAEYTMSWQVDGGKETVMADSSVDYPHKESAIDVAGWNWNGTGPYVFTLTARSKTSKAVVGKTTRSVYIDKPTQGTVVTIPVVTPTPVPVPSAPVTPAPPTPVPVSNSTNPLSGKKLYVNPNSPAAKQVSAWSQSRPGDAALMQKIASKPHPVWLGSWAGDAATAETIRSTISAAQSAGAVPTFVLYNIPLRDCGSYSAGGTNNGAAYQTWVELVTKTIGRNSAIVIVEPDALSQFGCLNESAQADRMQLLKNAVTTLKANSSATVYVDAGHAGWISTQEMAERLKKAAIESADGFSVNVSNFDSTVTSTNYGKEIASRLGNKHFVIDTSRNGQGASSEWCNPSGRALGQAPTTNTGEPLVDAYLWLKVPGESDGTCNGGPSAGTWWSDFALGLASRANW